MSPRRQGGSWFKEKAAMLGVLTIIAAVDAAGAVTAAFAPAPEPITCPTARPDAVLVDSSTPPIAGDPVARYAPLVYLDKREQALPMSVDCFLESAELGWAAASPANDVVLEQTGRVDTARLGGAQGGYSVDDGGVFRSHEFTRPYAELRARLSGRRGFFLDAGARFRKGPVEPLDRYTLTPTPLYYEFVPGHYVTYWFFYGFSAPAGATSTIAGMLGHEADWERITVRLTGARATKVAYYQHGGEPQIVDYTNVSKEGTHPVVFSGRGSHASYPIAGLQQEFIDRTGRGRAWRTWQFLADVTRQSWYRYGGAWGIARAVPGKVSTAAFRVGLRIGDGEFTGPSGPCSKKPAPDDWLLNRGVPPPGPGICAPR
jgi:Vacuolar protein sorting-associated protein 62